MTASEHIEQLAAKGSDSDTTARSPKCEALTFNREGFSTRGHLSALLLSSNDGGESSMVQTVVQQFRQPRVGADYLVVWMGSTDFSGRGAEYRFPFPVTSSMF